MKPTYFNTGWWLGDGFCDDDLNNEECNWDNGDCDSALATTVTSSFSSCNPPIHILTLWIGDGFCDTELNNLDCGNDGGDCNDGMTFNQLQQCKLHLPQKHRNILVMVFVTLNSTMQCVIGMMVIVN